LEINPDILKRYNEHTASEAERKAVEEWLDDHSVETSIIPTNELYAMKASVWDRVHENIIGTNGVKLVGTRKKSDYLPLTAALGLLLLIGLICQQLTSRDQRYSDAIVITSAQGDVEILDDHCRLQFSGYLQVFNRSSKVKSIECSNGEKYTLAPGETYYLETIDGKHSIVQESNLSPEDNCSRFIRGDVKIYAGKAKNNV